MEQQTIINECIQLFKQKFDNVEIPPIYWNSKMRSTAGKVKSRRATRQVICVELNPHLLTTAEKLRDTLLHELAHVAEIVLFGNGGHGNTWKRCMQVLGQPATRCHDYDVEHLARRQQRVQAKCSCKTHAVSKVRANRIRQGTRYTCKKCATVVELI